MRRLLRAWKEAEKLLDARKIRRPPVNVAGLATPYAKIIHEKLDPEISGVLVPIETQRWAILVNRTHPKVRQRFTIAHELGHIVLHGYTTAHADRGFLFRDARSSAGSAIEEIEANQFAAELLMPRKFVIHATRDMPFQHTPRTDDEEERFERWVRQLAREFEVSRQAMAVRLATIFA